MLTKNRQSDSIINEMIKKAFPEKTVAGIKELTEGMCNVTYNITFSNGEECILKIAAKDTTGNTSNEICLMAAEVRAMQLVKEHCSFKVADVLAYDCSRTICDGDYFFMEKLPGSNYTFIKETLPEEVKREIAREIGEISRQLCSITNPQFGFLGDEKRYDHLSDFVQTMLQNLISDGQKKEVDLGCDARQLLEEFEKTGATVVIATDDGSLGTHGTVVDAIRENDIDLDVIYSCGPKPMLRALKALAEEKDIPCYVSMEERMACGVGACLGCVCETKDVDDHSKVHNKRICKDGPVFEAREVIL